MVFNSYRHLTAVLLLFACGLALAAPSGDAEVRQAWQLLDYIAVDYAGAVAGGKVINEGEYAEMREFSATARDQIAALPENPQRATLLGQADGLIALVEHRAATPDVARSAHALAGDLLAAYGVAAAPARAPDLATGKVLYAQQCASCHGASGRGDGPAGADLAPPPIAFSDAERAAQRTPLALYEAISRGVPGTAMMAFPQLSEDQRWALAFYVGGLAMSDADRTDGERLWKANATARAALPSLEALAHTSQIQLAQTLDLDARQAQAILAYLRAQPQALTAVEQKVRALVPGEWQMVPHVYGHGAVRPLPLHQHSSHEAGLVLEFISRQSAVARTAAGVFKQNLLHHSYPGRMTTGGNLAFAFTPSEVDAHQAYRFALYHVLRDAPLERLFRVEAVELDGNAVH